MTAQTFFIVNPASAHWTTAEKWRLARRSLESTGLRVAEHVTSRPGEAVEASRNALMNGFGAVVAVGGDGTMNEVLNGYLDSTGRAVNPEASLGLLPSGTGSDFRKSLSLGSGLDAVRALESGKKRRVDAVRLSYTDENGRAASRFLINAASFGFGGAVASAVNRGRGDAPSRVAGRIRFLRAAISALGQYVNVNVRIRLDGCRDLEVKTGIVVAANGRFAGGGMMLAPNARLDDGLLDIILIDRANRVEIARELGRVWWGGHLKNRKVLELRAADVSITAAGPLAIEADGEALGFAPARLTVLPGAVSFIG